MPKTTRATHKAQDDVLNAVAKLHAESDADSAHREAINAIYSKLESQFGYEPGDFAPDGHETPPVVEAKTRAKKAG